jgi:hypothetical protein
LHHPYSKFDVEREFAFTTNTLLPVAATVFFGDKFVAGFFYQVLIFCNDTLIVDNLDFTYELNILGATYTDEIKRKHSMTYTCTSAVTEKLQDQCGVYLDLDGIAIGSPIRLAYEVIIPMTTLNIFDRIQYWHRFFGVWTFEIVPTLDNMVYKVIDYNCR